MSIVSKLKPENSIVASAATVGLVYGIYSMDIGTVSMVHSTQSNDPNISASLKKAGYTALILVGGLSLIAKDANIFTLGMATVAVMQLHYHHANMADPVSGQITLPSAPGYAPAANVIPISQQGTAASYG